MDNFTIKNKKLLLVGKTNSGKSQLLRFLLIKEKKHFSKIFLFSPTEKINKFYEKLIKKENMFEQFTENWLETLMKKLTNMSEKPGTKFVIVQMFKKDPFIVIIQVCGYIILQMDMHQILRYIKDQVVIEL